MTETGVPAAEPEGAGGAHGASHDEHHGGVPYDADAAKIGMLASSQPPDVGACGGFVIILL